MSLRTKLLAVVIGLPVAILLFALVLFVRRGERTSQEAINAVLQAAGAERTEVAEAMLAIEDGGEFQALYYVMGEHRGDGGMLPEEVWRLRDRYKGGVEAQQVTDVAERRAVLRNYKLAQGGTPPIHLDSRTLAVVAEDASEGSRMYGFVCSLKEVPDRAQDVYLVMLGGIALLMIVFYWLLS